MRSTLCLALASICVSFPFAAHSQTTSGSIWGSETWDSTMNPILVTGDVTIEEGATLTIEAGSHFEQKVELLLREVLPFCLPGG